MPGFPLFVVSLVYCQVPVKRISAPFDKVTVPL